AAKYANVNPIKLPIKKVTEVGNGELFDISEEAKVKFKLLNDINNYYCSTFFIMPNPNKQIILGMRFLLENESIINLREGFINLDGFEYEVSTRNHEENYYEQALIKKSKTFTLSEQEDKIEALILKAKRENPTFGTIPPH
ncbi:hypothetical protein DMUE_5715, partial [Dictyocoela muelleri]